MPELLTESFCERCGTRYAFETPEPDSKRAGRLKQARTLARGLRNFVLDDSLPLDAALADARRDDDRDRATQQLEAFHRTFNFCLDCRQYTCLDCWNEAEGRCLTCAPRPGVIEPAAIRLAPPEVNGHDGLDLLPWPTDGAAELVPGIPAVDGEVSLREAVEAAAEAATTVPTGPAEPSPESLHQVEPLPEPEPIPAAAEAAGDVEPAPAPVEALPAVEVVAPIPEPETPAALPPAAWPPALPVAADHRPASPFPATPPPPPSAPAPWPPLGPVRPGEPAWPSGPSPLLPPSAFGGRGQEPALEESLGPWQASSAQVAARSAGASIRSCVSCGLALSSTAHFCRRCGSPQSV